MTRAPHLERMEPAFPEAITPSNHHSQAPSEASATAENAEETFVVPASLEQTRYWTLAQIDPGSTASNMAISCELEGTLDPLIVEQAIAGLTLRHEALRTLFRVIDGQLSQVILTRPLYEFTQQDLSRQDGAPVAQETLAAALSAHSHLRIDLEHGPVLRARLLRLSDERHVLALTMNHIVCDGWSNGLLMRDLMRIYHALRTGRGPLDAVAAGAASDLPELPFQFADFTIWQNEYLDSSHAKEALAFWTSHIPRDLPALDMPADHPRRPGRSFPGTIASALLPAAINQQLIDYCRRSGSTKHIVLLAAFQALCARYSGQQRFLLGSTIANRTQPGMEDVVGRFANPQVIVADVTGDPNFQDLEQRVRDWETSAYTHQDLPFSRIIEALQTDQEGGGTQFLEVWFVYQRAFMQPQDAPGVRLTPLRSVSGGVDFDMLVSVVERAEGPRLQIEYNTELFERARIDALLLAFEQMLAAALTHPETALSQLALPQAAASSQPHEMSATAEQHPKDLDLLATVAAHAAAMPAQVAVRAAARQLSWAELEERSVALASYLEREGLLTGADAAYFVAAPEVETLVVFLALLRLGEGAPRITPLPAHVDVAALQNLFTAETLVLAPSRLLDGRSDARTFAYERIPALPPAAAAVRDAGQPAAWGMLRCEQNSAAASVTDSVSFSETLHAAAAVAARLALSSGDVLLAVAPSAAADAFFDLLLALVSGAALELIPWQPGLALQPLLNASQVTVALAEPAQWRAWQAAGWSGDRRLTAVARGRHAFQPGWQAALPLRSTIALLSGEGVPVAALDTGSQGFRALPGVALSLLDTQRQMALPGVIGELSSGGRSLGYPAQSLPDGSIRILGDPGSIVPLHGHRIRLGDLESALLAMPGVFDVATAIEPRADGAPVLAAWVAGNMQQSPAELRRQLAATLPAHLVPATLRVLPAIPYRTDGSPDWQALHRTAPAETSAPSVAEEEQLAFSADDVSRELSEIWKDVLSLATVDPHLSFFAAGGNSLLLVRLFARLNKAFGTRLPITTIFDAETVAKLSARLRQQGEIRAMVPVQTHGYRPPVFMIHSYLLYQGLSQALGNTQPFYGLRELEADSELGMEERVANYVREIRAVQPHGPYSVMGWCAAGPLTIEVARQLIEAGETMSCVILFDSWLPGYLNSVESTNAQGSLRPLVRGLREKLERHGERMRTLSPAQRVRYARGAVSRFLMTKRNRFFIRHWSTFNQLANRFHLPLPQFMYNTTLTTFAALHAYRARPVPVRLTLIRAHDTRDIPGASAACGWEQVAMHGVDVLWAPGDHETMFLGEKLEATTELVRRCLRTVETKGAPTLASPSEGRLLHAGTH